MTEDEMIALRSAAIDAVDIYYSAIRDPLIDFQYACPEGQLRRLHNIIKRLDDDFNDTREWLYTLGRRKFHY